MAAFIHLFGLSSKNAHNLSNERRHLYFQFTPFIIRRVFEVKPKSITSLASVFQMPVVVTERFSSSPPYPRSAAENDSDAFGGKQQKEKNNNNLSKCVNKASTSLKGHLQKVAHAIHPVEKKVYAHFTYLSPLKRVLCCAYQKAVSMIVTKSLEVGERLCLKHRPCFILVKTRT